MERLIRPNIRQLQPYRCARDDYSLGILLDANENPYPAPVSLSTGGCVEQLNRYPDPHQVELRKRLAEMRGLPSPDYVFVGNGSDEAIDLLVRLVCRPGLDRALCCPPTYGMYAVSAAINDVQMVRVPLSSPVDDGETGGVGGKQDIDSFQLQIPQILQALGDDAAAASDANDGKVKLIFLCSPGNPTGRALRLTDVQQLLDKFTDGLVVMDEAYIDFAEDKQDNSACQLIERYQNLVVLQTMSKAYGLAGIR